TYCLSAQALFFINYVSNFTIKWFLWPVLLWPVALAIHGIIFYITLNRANKEKKSWIERKIDEELQKIQNKGD
ncbi:MAG: 2TM domain-containing protein, partial [Promethearchaeota archaeon]